MFARKRSAKRGKNLSLADLVPDATNDHQAKLLSEVRLCPSCGYRLINPMTDKCPRCFSHVPPSDHTNCGECDYQGNCELARVAKHRKS